MPGLLSRLFELIAYAWRTPNAFRDDWKKFGRNQAGHGALGLVGGLVAAVVGIWHPWAPVAGTGLLSAAYAVWEVTQHRLRRADDSDCWEDWAFFYSGVVIGAFQFWWGLPIMFAHLMAGMTWRIEIKREN